MPSDVREQIERRRQRGEVELARIVNRGAHPVLSTFEVGSRSGGTYRVRIRSLDERHNGCTCPDYRTNLIGTCKHVEGVLLHLEKAHGRRLRKLAAEGPAGTEVFLHHGTEVAVRASVPSGRIADADGPVPRLVRRFFDSVGYLTGPPLEALPAFLAAVDDLPAVARARVHVDDEVREYLDLLRDREEMAGQRRWFLDEIEAGRRSLDLLAAPLYPFQEEGALHLAFGRRAVLADDMGLGKTVQALAAAVLLRELRGIERVLVVCPASLKHQWAREIRRFTSLPVTVIEGNLQARRARYREPTFFKTVNYEVVRRDGPELEALAPDLVILDEAQRIKNWRTKTAAAVKRLPSRYAFVLTGTPLENRLDELYSIFQFLDPRILGPLWSFNDRFYQVEERASGSYKVLGYKNVGELRRTIRPHVLRRTRDEVLKDLPERVDSHFFVEITPAQRRPYEEFREVVAQIARKAKRRPLTPQERDVLLKSLLKMRLIANALALHDKELPEKERERTAPKLAELAELLAEEVAGNGRKALVFSQWSEMLKLAEPVLERLGLGYVKLTGDVPSARRGALLDRFADDPECRVFPSTDAGGVGLNLQSASLVIHLDLPWNPAVLDQRTARAHRHGQRRSVQVVHLVAKGTIEERLLDRLATKRSVFRSLFGPAPEGDEIAFEDLGQGLMAQLDELIEAPERPVELALEPTAEPAGKPVAKTGAGAGSRPGGAAYGPAAEEVEPGGDRRQRLRSFADRLRARLAGRVLLVRDAPAGAGVLVVIEDSPGEARAAAEELAYDCFEADPPPLHLLEPEGYRTLAALLPAGASKTGEEAFRASSLARPPAADRQADERVASGLAQASRRLALAEHLVAGGFTEEVLRPLRDALGWGLSSLLALGTDGAAVQVPSAEPPAARRIQTRLVEPGVVPSELALGLARVRELTEPVEPDGLGAEAPAPLSPQAVEPLLASVRALIDLAEQRRIAAAL